MCSCNLETLDTSSSSIGGVTEGCHSSSLCASHEPKIWGEGERSGRKEKRRGREKEGRGREKEGRGRKREEGGRGKGNREKGEKE